MGAIVLQTPRLRLREMDEADLDFLAAMLGDAEVMRFYPKVLDRAEAGAWMQRTFDRYARDGHGWWIVEERSTGAPAGQIGLLEQEWDGQRDTEVAYMLHRPFWKQGYALEGASACRDHALETLGRGRVISMVRDVNLPSAAVARKLGMSPLAQTVRASWIHDVFAIASSRQARSR